MPIYEYACEKCQHEFEVEQRITDDPVKSCPECRSRKVKRLISKTFFVLKGGGWYSDLYASGKDKDKDKDDKKTEKTSDSENKDSSKKSDSKSDSKDKSKTAGGSKEKSKAKGNGKSSKAVA